MSQSISEFWGDLRSRVWLGIGIFFVVAFFILMIWRAAWVTFVDKHEYGFVFDKLSGQVYPVGHTGYVVANPFFYGVHTIDTRPYQVSISANERILNAKLVRFNVNGIKTFVSWHGVSAGDQTSDLKEILKCYAFDRDEGRDCPFLEVVSVLAPNQGMPLNQEDKK